MLSQVKKFFKSIHQQFLQMNDSPHNIALAFSLGVFLGILPFTGLLAAISIAWYLRLNKAAAILGSVLTNTWLGIIILAVAIKMSGIFLGVNSEDVVSKFQDLFKHFDWQKLSDPYILKIVTSVIFGFFVISLVVGFLSYFLCLAIIYWQRRRR